LIFLPEKEKGVLGAGGDFLHSNRKYDCVSQKFTPSFVTDTGALPRFLEGVTHINVPCS